MTAFSWLHFGLHLWEGRGKRIFCGCGRWDLQGANVKACQVTPQGVFSVGALAYSDLTKQISGAVIMASVREVSSIAEDLLCPVCLSVFQDPHMLDCGHNFCLSCLEKCVVPKGKHQGMCPECRGPFNLQDTARNRVLANLSEKARLLKLEEGSHSSGSGNWYFCEEHEEPLKLFCSQNEAPICVICRDLPQHQGHSFLPIKNAVKGFQENLKASLEPLQDGVKWATDNQSRQQETIEELNSLNQHLCGCIFIAFEELREILNEREQSMMETVKQMKEDNQAEMERRLECLKAYESSHIETISSIRAALEETNEFAFLKGIKELKGRIQDLKEWNEEMGNKASEDGEGEAKEGEDAGENLREAKGEDEGISGEKEAYGDAAQDTEEEGGAIVPVDPALEDLEELLDFDSWKEMLRSIRIGEIYAPDLPCSSPTLEEDMLQPGGGDISAAARKEVIVQGTTDACPSAPGGNSCTKQTPQPSSRFVAAPGLLGMPYQAACSSFSSFPMSVPRRVPFLPNAYNPTVLQCGPTRRWHHSRWGRGIFQGRGIPHNHPFGPSLGQGRGYYPNTQISEPNKGSVWFALQQHQWRPPRKEGAAKRETPKSREGHGSGRGGGGGEGWFSKQKSQSTADQSRAGTAKHEAQASGQVRSGQGGESEKRPPVSNKGGQASSGSRGSQHRHQAFHHRGGGSEGAGSAKGHRNK